MSLLMPLLLGFGPAGDAPTPPVGAALAVADQADGTGATATISGTGATAANDVLVYSLAGVLVDTFTRIGNGTVDLVIVPGQYAAVLTSDNFVADDPQFFSVTTAGGLVVDHAELLEVLLSYSTTWQSLAGAASAGAALARSRRYEFPDSDGYPMAIIHDDPLWSGPLAVGTTNGGGALTLTMFVEVNIATYTTREARRDYVREQIYAIRREMLELSNSRATPAGYSVSHLVVRKMTLTAPPFELAADKIPAKTGRLPAPIIWGAEFSVEW